MKKNLVIMFMAGLIVITGVGCSKHYEGEKIEGTENIIEKEAENEDGAKIDKRVLNADIFDNVIQIGEKVIEMPCSYNEIIEKNNLTISDDNNELLDDLKDIENINDLPEHLIPSGESETFAFEMDQFNNIFIKFKNSDIKDKKIKDCQAVAIITGDNKNIFFPQGISCNSTIDDVFNIMGKPLQQNERGYNTTLIYSDNENVKNISLEDDAFANYNFVEIIVTTENKRVNNIMRNYINE